MCGKAVPLVFFCLGAAALSAVLFARSRIWTQSELEGWCKDETGAVLVKEHVSPTNWAPVMYGGLGEHNLRVIGQWRVGSNDVLVQCNSKWGARSERASYEIQKW
jgi:hypothetical protein